MPNPFHKHRRDTMDSNTAYLNSYLNECDRFAMDFESSGTPLGIDVTVVLTVPTPGIMREAFLAFFADELDCRWRVGRDFTVRYDLCDGLRTVLIDFTYDADDSFLQSSIDRYYDGDTPLDECDLFDRFAEEYGDGLYLLLPHGGRMYPMHVECLER